MNGPPGRPADDDDHPSQPTPWPDPSSSASSTFDEVLEILSGATAVPPDKARTLYRVITALDGVTKPAEITDGAGRTVLALGMDGNFRDYAFERNSIQVLLDPETYACRGVRRVAGMDYYVGGKASGGPLVKGTQIGMATRISTTVVDEAGGRA